MTSLKQAVILAAGKGERLTPIFSERPKGFIELAGQPIIERSIKRLLASGFQTITVVTGYAATYYEALARRYPAIRLIHNPHYADSGSLYSLYCAREAVTGSALIIESDLVYENRALEVLLNYPRSTAILMSGFTHSGDEVYLSTRGEYFLKMSKRREELPNVAGELVGLSKVSPEAFAALMQYAEKCFQRDRRWHYEDGFNGIADMLEVFVCKLDDLIWAEIDTPEHLRRVQEKILPQLSSEW